MTERVRQSSSMVVAQLYQKKNCAPQHHHVESNPGRSSMLVIYTNCKGLMYMLYQGQTKTSKSRYYFSRTE